MWISQVAKQLSFAVAGATLVTLGIFSHTDDVQAATLTKLQQLSDVNSERTVTSTLPEYNFDGSPPFPAPQNLVGIFSYTIASNETIVSAVISGTFGNSLFTSSAGVDVYLDNLLVAQCFEFDQCWEGPGPVNWSFTFDSSNFSLLEDGEAILTAAQTSEFVSRLGVTTLTIETITKSDPPQPPTSIPEPTAIVGLLGVVAGLSSLRKQ